MKNPAYLPTPSTLPAVPHTGKIVLSVVSVTVLYIVLALILHPADRELDYHFYSERGLITGLSALFLASAGTLSMAIFFVHVHSGVRDIVSWIIIALGFYFLSLDEVAQFHERLGDVLDERVSSGVFRHWNDIIVILYGVVALPALFAIVPSLVRYRFTLYFMLIAFGFYFLHTAVDSLVESATVWSIIIEESAKLFCGAMLVISMLLGFLGALNNTSTHARD